LLKKDKVISIMVQFNRETLMIVAVAVCLFSCFYLYKETQKQKVDLSAFTSTVLQQIQSKQAPVNDGNKKKPVVVKPEVIDEENDD